MADSAKSDSLANSQADAKSKKSKDEGGGDGERLVVLDPRANWFEERVCNALKIKGDKWKKMVATPEHW
jgi:hypothetical protein